METEDLRSVLQEIVANYQRQLNDEETKFSLKIIATIMEIIDTKTELIELAKKGKTFHDFEVDFPGSLNGRRRIILDNTVLSLDGYKNLTITHITDPTYGDDFIRISWETNIEK